MLGFLQKNKYIPIYCVLGFAFFALVTFWYSPTAMKAQTPEIRERQQLAESAKEMPDRFQKIFDELDLECPEGTTFDLDASQVDNLRCDVKNSDEDIYPISKAEAYITHEDEFEKKVSASYPDWYRGNQGGTEVTNDSFHFYYTLMGPGSKAPGHDTDNIFCTTFYLRPEKTYIAHNHPSREFYYIIDGEGIWYGGDKVEPIKQGSFMVHPPYVSHGFKNTSKTTNLRAFVCWWLTPEDREGKFEHGGLPTNPCLAEREFTARGYPVSPVCKN